MEELILYGCIFVAVVIAIKIINAVNNSSPEEKFFRTFKIPYGASEKETERAFLNGFIRAKSPLARIYGELCFLEDRDDLTVEESKKKTSLKKEEVKVLQALKDVFETAHHFRPREAKAVAEDLNVNQLLTVFGQDGNQGGV